MPCAATQDRQLWERQKNHGPQHPLSRPPIHMEVGPSFVPKTHSRGGQRQERRGHSEVKQHLEKVEKELRHRHDDETSLLDSLRLRDKSFGHTPQTGDHHQGYAGNAPTHIPATGFEVPSRDAEAGNRNHWGDDVAGPIHDIQDGAFDGGRLLSLNGLAELGRGPKVLSGRCKRRQRRSQEERS